MLFEDFVSPMKKKPTEVGFLYVKAATIQQPCREA